MQRLVHGALAVAKESVKTITYESLNNVARLINGVSGLLLAVLPGKAVVLEGIQDWELKPTLRGPRLPRWMENGVSSFNQVVHELSVDSDGSSSVDYSSDDSDGSIYPDSPSSNSPRLSRASNSGNHDKHWAHWTGYMFLWILLPAKIMLAIAFRLSRILTLRDSRASLSSDDLQNQNLVSLKKVPSHKDHAVQRTTDRRRGIIEDLHLAIEIAIEAVFDVAHNAAHCIFSPIEVMRKVVRWLLPRRSGDEDDSIGSEEVSVPAATLGDHDPTPIEQTATFQQSLNTDARTCEDVITELGYPYEAIRVVTSDGYVLIMERIPRPESRKAVFLQHGIMDSSMGWVSNGVVGSPAFAAFDQGYDVFLGNFRGLVSREHVDKSLSSKQYWRYSINEHGTEDIPAMIEMIHTIKTSELKSKNDDDCIEEKSDDQPYKLCAICHSLGGAAILMYVITRRIEEKPHRLSRLILLSPAGFHEESNLVFTVVEHLFLFFAPLLAPFIPGFYIPTRFFRMLFNKLARDFHNYPALGGLVQTLMSYLVGGDSSNWVGVIGISHYNMDDMPGVSFQVALHLAQMKRSKKFIMYDYGSSAANYEIYGSHEPLDLGEYYSLIDIPVDLVAGKKDKIIRPSMVKKHYDLMKDTNPDATYREFEYAHLDFTFSHREELLAYVMSRLLLVGMSGKQQASQKPVKLKKKIEG